MNNSVIPQLPQASIYEPTIQIQKIQPHYRFDANNMPKIDCYFHAGNPIKYFCRNQECLMPLCDKCVKPHLDQQHQQTQSNIVPYEAILSEIYQNLAADCNEMCDQLTRIQQLTEKSVTDKLTGKQSLQTNPVKLIDSARDQVIAIVNNYFDTLKTYLLTQIEEPQPDIDVKPAVRELKLRWETNIKDLETINNPSSTVEKVIEYCEEQLRKRNDQIMIEADHLIRLLEAGTPQYRQYGIDIPQLFVDPTFLPRFLWVLERYAYFHGPPQEPVVLPPQRIVETVPIPTYEPLPPPPRYIDHYSPVVTYPPVEPLVVREPIVIREPVFRDSLIRDDDYMTDYDEDLRRREWGRGERGRGEWGRFRGEGDYGRERAFYDDAGLQSQSQKKGDAAGEKSQKRKSVHKQKTPEVKTRTIEEYEVETKKNKSSKKKGPKEFVFKHEPMVVTTSNINYVPQVSTPYLPSQNLMPSQVLQPNNAQMQLSVQQPATIMKKSKLSSSAYTKN